MQALGAALVLLWGCRSGEPVKTEAAPASEAVRVRIRSLAATSVARTERRTARTEARREVSLAFGVPGRVTRVLADEGDAVDPGALLAAVDARALSAQVAQAEAQVAQAARELARLEKLRAKNAVPTQQIDQLGSTLAVARAQLDAARAQLDQARIRAPFAADVVKRFAEPGAWANPGVPILHLAELDPIRVVVPVPDHVRPSMRVGASAQVHARGLEAPRSGEVVRVSPVVDPRTGLIRVEIDVPNPDRRLAAGQPVEVAIDAGTLDAVVVLDPDWVVYRHDGPAVVVVEAGRARTVSLGAAARRVEGRFVVPQSSLPNLPVVIEGQSMVREGREVIVVEGDRASAAKGLPR